MILAHWIAIFSLFYYTQAYLKVQGYSFLLPCFVGCKSEMSSLWNTDVSYHLYVVILPLFNGFLAQNWAYRFHIFHKTVIILLCVWEGLFLLLKYRMCQLTVSAPPCLVCSWAQQHRSVDRSLLSCGRKKACVRRGFSIKVVNKGIVLIWRKYRVCSLYRCCLGSRRSTVFLMLSAHIAVFVVIFVTLSLCQCVCRQEVQWVEVC